MAQVLDKFSSLMFVYVFRVLKELICMLLTSLFTFPLFILLFTLYYDALHMVFELHGEECVLSLAAIYGTIICIADRNFTRNGQKSVTKGRQNNADKMTK